jgi:hypothetical protein
MSNIMVNEDCKENRSNQPGRAFFDLIAMGTRVIPIVDVKVGDRVRPLQDTIVNALLQSVREGTLNSLPASIGSTATTG